MLFIPFWEAEKEAKSYITYAYMVVPLRKLSSLLLYSICIFYVFVGSEGFTPVRNFNMLGRIRRTSIGGCGSQLRIER